MRSRPAAVFVGAATMDAIALVPSFPGHDDRVVAESVVFAGGGPAATAAVAATRLGVDSAFIGTIGDDDHGARIVDGLRAEGVDVSGVTVDPTVVSGSSVIVVDRGRGTRAICSRPAPAPTNGAGRDLVLAADWAHADHIGWGALADLSAPIHHERRLPRISLDAGNPVPGLDVRGIDLYVPTVEALRLVHGDLDVETLLQTALSGGAGCVVATDGSRGSSAASRAGERAHAPAHRVDVVSTLGAGDVFHGALVAAQVHGLSLPESLRYANITAALSCRGLDGRSAIPDHAEVIGILHSTPSTPSTVS